MGLARPGAHPPLTLEDGKEGIASGSLRHFNIPINRQVWGQMWESELEGSFA